MRVSPHHYAQCQLGMLATRTRKALFIMYGPKTTRVTELTFDEVWIRLMFHLLGWVNVQYLLPKKQPEPNFCQDLTWYKDFLDLTRKSCEQAAGTATFIVSSLNGNDENTFLH